MTDRALPQVASVEKPAGVDPDAVRSSTRPAQSLVSEMEESTFRRIYTETAPRLRGFLLRSCGRSAAADDLLQETFYRWLRSSFRYESDHQARAYLYRIASSLLVDRWRARRREELLARLSFRRNHHRHDELGQDIRSVFRSLKPREQSLLWLADVEGFDHREIAEILKLKAKSVRVVLFRARRKFAGLLEEKGLAPEVNS